jgi:hypothetical protein
VCDDFRRSGYFKDMTKVMFATKRLFEEGTKYKVFLPDGKVSDWIPKTEFIEPPRNAHQGDALFLPRSGNGVAPTPRLPRRSCVSRGTNLCQTPHASIHTRAKAIDNTLLMDVTEVTIRKP